MNMTLKNKCDGHSYDTIIVSNLSDTLTFSYIMKI